MLSFTRKKMLIQILKDYSFGFGLFITIFAVAGLDARSAWPAQMTTAETIIEKTTDATVDKIAPQHNLAKLLSESHQTDFETATNNQEQQFKRSDMTASTALQIFSSNALFLAFIALLFASMFTLTSAIWRNVRREYASPRRTGWRRD